MSNLLAVNNLSIKFKAKDGNDFVAASNISFNIRERETICIVGESGSGKSVVCLSIMKLLPYPLAYHDNKSSIRFLGDEILDKNNKKMQAIRGKKISMIFQEPMTSLNPNMTCGNQIAESITGKNLNKLNLRSKVLRLLSDVEFQDPKKIYDSFPHQISGGQRQRVMIAMAISNNPKLLIADEPTTALDVNIEQSLLELLKKLQEKLNLSIIFITHDLNIVKKIADKVLVMQKGEVEESGSVNDIFQNPKKEYTRRLINSTPPQKENYSRKENCILRIDSLNLTYKKKNFFGKNSSFDALKDINLELYENTAIGLVGESGSGKSSLARSILGIEKYSGQVFFQNKEFSKMSRKSRLEFRKSCQLVFQDPFGSLSPRLKVFDILKEGLDIHEKYLSEKKKKDRVLSVLKDVRLDQNSLEKYPHEFSGGQRQRIALAKVLILNPRLLVLDEPTSALDISIQKEIIKLLLELQSNRGLTYLLISHDLKVVNALADQIVVLKSGKIVESGTRDEIFNNPLHEYTKSLIEAAYN